MWNIAISHGIKSKWEIPLYWHPCGHCNVLLCAGSTVMVNTGSWRSSAPAGTIVWTWRIIPSQSIAPPTDTTQTGRVSNEVWPAGSAPPETNVHHTTHAHHWVTVHLSTTHLITRPHQIKCGTAGRHNQSWRVCEGRTPHCRCLTGPSTAAPYSWQYS